MGNNRHIIDSQKTSGKFNTKLLYLTTSKYEEDWPSTRHSHYCAELFYVFKGNGSFIVENQEFSVKEGDLVIINPNVEHTEKSIVSQPMEYVVVGIDGLMFNFNQEENYIHYNMCNFGHDRERLQFHLITMVKEMEGKKTEYEAVCQNLLEVLLIQIARHNKFSIEDSNGMISKNISKECSKVKRYFDSNYSENISLENLSSITNMNKYYLIHAFTKYTGMSPINYLNNRRIEESKALLETTDHSIAEISSMIGFSSQSYFSQAFRKKIGISPNEYKKKKKQENK